MFTMKIIDFKGLVLLVFKSIIPKDSGIKILDLLDKIYLR
jgi:hypothetical protein